VGLVDRLLRRTPVPAGSVGRLEDDEDVLAVAEVRTGHLVATRFGMWVPGEDGPLRLEWHLVSRATWDGATLEFTVAEQTGTAGYAVLLADVQRRSYALADPGRLPQVVNQRVTASVRSAHRRELPGGGAWFVQRSLPGRSGVQLQVRVDPGTDPDVVADVAAAVAAALPRARA
jgi:hypothetical protein